MSHPQWTLGGERLHPRSQTRNFARGCIAMQNSARDTALKLRLCCAKCLAGCRCVARRDSGLDLLHERTNTAHTGAVDNGSVGVAPNALFGRLVVGHRASKFLLNSSNARLLRRKASHVKPFQPNFPDAQHQVSPGLKIRQRPEPSDLGCSPPLPHPPVVTHRWQVGQ